MKERQRWKSEEDAILRAYVKQFGAREWHLVSLRMNTPLDRDAKSCLERWKNYLKPGIKKGSLTEEEQRLVIRLQAKHGNKWKKIASEVPGRTAKRLGKWWEVFREKQQREEGKKGKHRGGGGVNPMEEGKYDEILESMAEKVVNKEQTAPPPPPFLMATSSDPSPPSLPPWLSSNSSTPSVTLTLSPMPSTSTIWAHQEAERERERRVTCECEVGELCRELEEGHRAWLAHRKEAGWRLRRVEVQLEAEKAIRKKEKMEEFDMKMKSLRDEETASLERIESEYREQLGVLRRDADAKEQKLSDQWISCHTRLTRFLYQHQLGASKSTTATTTRHV